MDKENNLSNPLDAGAIKRFEKIITEWDKVPDSSIYSGLRIQDLRFLLENFEPLRALIKSIATQQPSELATEVSKTLPAKTSTDNTEQYKKVAAAAEKAVTEATEELTKTKNLLDAAKEKIATLNAKVEKQTQANNELEKELLEYKQKLTRQLSETEQQVAEYKLKLAEQNKSLDEINFLRNESELTQRLDLGNLPSDNTQALIQIVAVLAQKDNLERLWQALKTRCEAESRAANTDELQLLKTALAWYNHNWRTRPFQLIEIPSGSSYDYEQHQKSSHTSGGETVHALHLPGIADGSGKPLCKALVNTR